MTDTTKTADNTQKPNQITNMKDAVNKNSTVKPVSISISGTTHRIACPADKIKQLEATADKLNEKIRTLRRAISNKSPNNEELLVLVCLELLDQLQNLQDALYQKSLNDKKIDLLIDKITQDIQAVSKP
ncbi:cell division protein ZapA [Moraxella nasovis]|uniref:cell division protein ZapA n=1 Tax=Moraxella nasovis TaxID=2904121 RepID=UPI001F615E02|nr:cell division protein ZapA [Moraxella nasovis]UNU73733.1 cell division protein ZapA [Moraxella nasovis]